MYRQYTLTTPVVCHACLKAENGMRTTTGWLARRLTLGDMVTLKHEPGVWWAVMACGAVELATPPDTTWQVGGNTGRLRL